MRKEPLLALTLLVSTHAAADICPTKKTGSLQQIVESWVNYNQPGNLYGLCAVAMDKYGNKGVACSGMANPWKAADHDTLFQIGSVTKTMTATLLAKRVAEGTIGLSDKVDRHLPLAYRNANNPITIQQLATHHSGLPRDASQFEGPANSLELLDDCIDSNCLTPGNPYVYSNWAFQILGFAIAHRDGYGISNWFRDLYYNVLSLNTMYATKLYEEYDASYLAAHAASGHTVNSSGQFVDHGSVPHPRCANGSANPSGCLYSSLHDMRLYLEYVMGLRTPTQVLRTARNHMREIYDDGLDSTFDMGLAWKFKFDLDCHALRGDTPGHFTRVSKSGEVIGQHAWIEFLQDPNNPDGVAELGVVVLANSDARGALTDVDLGEHLLSRIPLP